MFYHLVPMMSSLEWIGWKHIEKRLIVKNFECLDEEGNLKVVKCFPKVISGRQSSAIQLKNLCGKCCRVYAFHVLEEVENDTPRLEGFHVLQEFRNIFPDEIPKIPPKGGIDFIIELVPRVAPVSKTPYRMSILEMPELKMQLQVLLEKKYIKPSVSPWGAPFLFVKNKDDTIWLCIDHI